MRFLNGFPSVKLRYVVSIASIHRSKSLLHSHLKPPRSNQTLKEYLKSNKPIKTLLHFRDLLREKPVAIDSYSLLFALKASTQKPSSLIGRQLHSLLIKLGFELVIHLQTSLLSFYSSTGNLAYAQQVFDEMPDKNIFCWTSMISTYVENGKPKKAIEMFKQMQMDNVEPDEVTMTVALSACADLGALEMGEWIHSYIRVKKGFNKDLSLTNAIINMYVKCGDVKTARELFDSLKRKDVTTWTSMIVGHALHGQARDALELFEKMKIQKAVKRSSLIVPNDVTFIGVLMACSHGFMVEESRQYFDSMVQDYGLEPRNAHFGCIVDTFCRAGLLKEAYDYIRELPVKPNAVMWRTLLGACSLYGNIELGEKVRRNLLELDPDYVGDYVALSNLYAGKEMWNEKINTRDLVKMRRMPGKSWIEVDIGINEFVSGDNEHPLIGDIRVVLKCLIGCLGSCTLEFPCTMEH